MNQEEIVDFLNKSGNSKKGSLQMSQYAPSKEIDYFAIRGGFVAVSIFLILFSLWGIYLSAPWHVLAIIASPIVLFALLFVLTYRFEEKQSREAERISDRIASIDGFCLSKPFEFTGPGKINKADWALSIHLDEICKLMNSSPSAQSRVEISWGGASKHNIKYTVTVDGFKTWIADAWGNVRIPLPVSMSGRTDLTPDEVREGSRMFASALFSKRNVVSKVRTSTGCDFPLGNLEIPEDKYCVNKHRHGEQT